MFKLLLNLIHSAQNRIWLKNTVFYTTTRNNMHCAMLHHKDLMSEYYYQENQINFIIRSLKTLNKKMFDHGVKFIQCMILYSWKSYIFDEVISFTGSSNLDYRAIFWSTNNGLIKSKNIKGYF
nr:phospholipase D-like domain-containing protein [Entomoplasma sp. MP1]